jgi:chromosome segregation ATPase
MVKEKAICENDKDKFKVEVEEAREKALRETSSLDARLKASETEAQELKSRIDIGQHELCNKIGELDKHKLIMAETEKQLSIAKKQLEEKEAEMLRIKEEIERKDKGIQDLKLENKELKEINLDMEIKTYCELVKSEEQRLEKQKPWSLF